jgi:hypothetical protein
MNISERCDFLSLLAVGYPDFSPRGPWIPLFSNLRQSYSVSTVIRRSQSDTMNVYIYNYTELFC